MRDPCKNHKINDFCNLKFVKPWGEPYSLKILEKKLYGIWSLQNSQNDWFFLNLSKCHLVTAEVSRKFCTYLGSFSLKRDRFVGTHCTTLVDEFKGPCTSRTQQATVCSNTTTRWRFNYYNSALNMHTIVDFMEISSYWTGPAWTQLLRTFVTIVYPYTVDNI